VSQGLGQPSPVAWKGRGVGSPRVGPTLCLCQPVPQPVTALAELVLGRPGCADREASPRIFLAQLVKMPPFLADTLGNTSAKFWHRTPLKRNRAGRLSASCDRESSDTWPRQRKGRYFVKGVAERLPPGFSALRNGPRLPTSRGLFPIPLSLDNLSVFSLTARSLRVRYPWGSAG